LTSIAPDDYRDVQVQHRDDLWYPGTLEAYRKVEGVWERQRLLVFVAAAYEQGRSLRGDSRVDRPHADGHPPRC
jgi:hypothetical protein